jgi:hypothetical protein
VISGRFDEHGRPSLDGLISFPPIQRLQNQPLQIPITFVIDTGADRTLILPAHYEPYAYTDFRHYELDYPGGFGGSIEVRRVLPTLLHFRQDDGQFVRVTAEVEVARPNAGLRGYPSVLGRDVVDLYRLVVDKPAGHVYLE